MQLEIGIELDICVSSQESLIKPGIILVKSSSTSMGAGRLASFSSSIALVTASQSIAARHASRGLHQSNRWLTFAAASSSTCCKVAAQSCARAGRPTKPTRSWHGAGIQLHSTNLIRSHTDMRSSAPTRAVYASKSVSSSRMKALASSAQVSSCQIV